ncbi:MAG: type II toxin-antitoxin system RelE/ParE family toxin [Magnetococcales bacterium]|nr:type II toxin-antitoxin system RelE/ParE family toxin [Magnetococcales bacterium]
MKIFKGKQVVKWAQNERITDAVLRDAALEISAGKVDADLGGYLFKKRLARAGAGKSSGYRTIVGFRKADASRIIFLYGFAKNATANISAVQAEALSLVAKDFLVATEEHIIHLLERGSISEIENG